jgi:hypothetical protein
MSKLKKTINHVDDIYDRVRFSSLHKLHIIIILYLKSGYDENDKLILFYKGYNP